MNHPACAGVLALAFLLVPACGLPSQSKEKEEEDTKPASPSPTLVGRIASLPADRRFVLIQSYGGWSAPVDSILTTRGPDDRTANLKVTGESLGQFAAADIQSGSVEIGDAVYLQPVIPRTQDAPPAAATDALPADPKTGPKGEDPTPENN